MTTSRCLWTKAGGALPWLALALLITIAAWINSIINLGCLSPDPDCLSYDVARLVPENVVAAMTADLQSVTQHLLARINWGLASIGFPITAAAALVVALNVLWVCFGELSGRERIFGGLLIVGGVVLVIGIVLLGTKVFGPDVLSEPKVTTELRAATLHRTLMTDAVSVDKWFDRLAYAIFFLLTSAAAATLLWPATVASKVQLLRRRITRVHSLLYVGAAALAFRVLEMFFLYKWPGAWLGGSPATSADRIALAVSTAYGFFYTGVLASLFLPTALVLGSHATALADESTVDAAGDHDEWLSKAGLQISPFQTFGRVLAILGPLIAGGPVAKVIDMFGR
jgi:hypothetical protein